MHSKKYSICRAHIYVKLLELKICIIECPRSAHHLMKNRFSANHEIETPYKHSRTDNTIIEKKSWWGEKHHKGFHPFLLHFENNRRVICEQKSKIYLINGWWPPFINNNFWRHVITKQHQQVNLYVTWYKSRDVIIVRCHMMKVICLENAN